MVKAAYSSGKPAIGVGGHAPVVIDEHADIKRAVASILMSKTFDNGMICASEQAVVAVSSVYDAVRDRFASRGGHILSAGGTRARATRGVPQRASLAGRRRPVGGEDRRAGRHCRPCHHQSADRRSRDHRRRGAVRLREAVAHPFALIRRADFAAALDAASELVALGGIGHTSVLYTDQDRCPSG